MVIATEMSKPILKVSVSDDESSSDATSEGSENEEAMEIQQAGMSKPILKVSVSDDESSSNSTSEGSENEEAMEIQQAGMSKPILKVSVSDDESSSNSTSEGSENEEAMEIQQAGMSKPILKVSVSNNESSSDATSEGSENEEAMEIQASSENSGNSASEEDNSDDEESLMTNKGWGDSMSKILSSTKPKNKKTLVLSRAKKYSATQVDKVEKPTFEVIGDTKEEKPAVKKEDPGTAEPGPKKKKIEKPSIRVKPNILEKDRERLLMKIGTKGVVQLFNAVRNQQKTMEKEMDRSDLSEAKKEKILKKFDKRAFLDTLMGQTKSVVVDKETKPPKSEVKGEEDKPRWNALRDDFMMGAKMKDWDKESVDE